MSARPVGSLGRRLLPVIGVACMAAPAASAGNLLQDPWMTDRYEVEVVVFRHLDQSRNTPEQPAAAAFVRSSPLTLLPEPAVAGPYADPQEQVAGPADRVRRPTVGFYLLELEPQFPDFVTLTTTSSELSRVYARLQRLDAYEPLVHRVWMQGARPAEDAVPVEIHDDAGRDFHLTGTITLYKERYVHLEVSLDLTPVAAEVPAGPAPDEEPWPVFGDVFAPREPAVAPLREPGVTAFELRESRRIRGVNAQYFDHPQFGVIARVTEIVVDPEETEE